MVRLILDLPDDEWTHDLVVSQIDRYKQCWKIRRAALAGKDWVDAREARRDMEQVADEIINTAMMRGSWRVEEAHDDE